MPETSTLALFAVAAVTLLVIPGPAVLYIVTRSVDQGRAAGLASVCGVHVGTLLHVAAAALGLSALLVSSPTAYDTVRWLGAAYLVWLGGRRLLAGTRTSAAAGAGAGPDADATACGASSPGVVATSSTPRRFVLLRLPAPVRRPSRGSVPFQVIVFGVAFVVLGWSATAPTRCWPRPGLAGCAGVPGRPGRRAWPRAGS